MNRRHKPSPSFSSSLLDEIYRSIDGAGERDEKNQNDEREFKTRARTMREKAAERRNWSSSSSDSSSVGGFSSSEAEFRSSRFTDQRPKPIRTGFPVQNQRVEPLGEQMRSKSKENGFGQTKSKAMKIYGDLKKVKQPISPGGRIATFLNSLFTPGTPKKAKTSSSTRASSGETISQTNPKSKPSCTSISQNNPQSKLSCPSTCSSASSFSRSCLSNSSSRDKTSEAKRSVKFYPISIILGEDNYPKYQSEMRNTYNDDLNIHIMDKNHRAEAARDFLKSYQKVEYEYLDVRDTRNEKRNKFIDDDEDEDDDAASYASSDLFELDHLSAIEELPVYETTHLRTTLAIANGLISK